MREWKRYSGRTGDVESAVPLVAWSVLGFAAGLIAGYQQLWAAALAALALLCWWAAEGTAPVAVTLYFVAGCSLAAASSAPVRVPGGGMAADSSSYAERSRLNAAHAIDDAFADDAPMAKALLVADQREIPHDVKLRYADAGIIHMLSISGLHVTIIAAAVALVLQMLRLPTRMAAAGAVVVTLAYVWVLGFPAPALRSAVMVCAAAGCRAGQRHVSPWAVLALGALVPLARPETVLDLGYQLSVGGMGALIAAGSLNRRLRLARFRGWTGSALRAIVVSSVATLATAPIVAAAFGRLSIIAPITNLVADPVIAIAQPMLFLALLLTPLPHVARFVAAGVHPLLAAFDAIATAGAAVPYGAIAVDPSPAASVLAGVAAAALIVSCASRFPVRAALVALGAVCAAVWVA